MNEQERAEEHLRTIRRLMERGTIYRAISAPTALVGGLLSLAACAFLLRQPLSCGIPGSFHHGFIVCWLLVLLLTSATNALIIVVGARKRNEPAFSASMKTAFVALFPPFLAAAVLTIVTGGGDGTVVPMIWATFYGLGLLATSNFAPRSLKLLGWAFLLSGLSLPIYNTFAARFFPEKIVEKLSLRPGILFMAATFGLLHSIYALCAWPRKRAEPEP